jgi:hypothetical protein
METCRKLLPIVKAHEKNNLQKFVTGEESWFTLGFHSFMKWNRSRDDIYQKVKQQIGTQKFMLTVTWGIDEFHVVDLMAEQHSYSPQSFPSHILEQLLFAVFPEGRKPHFRRLSLYLNNCRVHC